VCVPTHASRPSRGLGTTSERHALRGASTPAKARLELGVEFVQVARDGHRHQVIATEETDFTFDSACFMALAWRTELGCKSPVRAKRDKARRLLAPMAAPRRRGRGSWFRRVPGGFLGMEGAPNGCGERATTMGSTAKRSEAKSWIRAVLISTADS